MAFTLATQQDEIYVEFDIDGMLISQPNNDGDNDVIRVAHCNVVAFVEALQSAVKAQHQDA